MSKLSEYGALNIRDFLMNQIRDKNSKIRYLFDVPDRDNALACYRFFNDHNQKMKQSRNKKDEASESNNDIDGVANKSFTLTEQMKIYLQKDEDIFERYANDEAEIYD